MKLTINELNLSSDTQTLPARGSANIPVEVENLSVNYSGYAIVPCVGWLENGVVVSTVREVENNIFTLPTEFFKNAGAVYIAVGLIKNNEKVKTNEIGFFVGEAPDTDIQLPSNGTWETAVSSLVSSLFNERFENEIDKILENAKTLNNNTESLQRQINTAIGYLGEYEWSGTQIRFKKGDGTWGPYKDIAGGFATKEELTRSTDTVKQLYLIMHPIGSIIFSTSDVNPGTLYGGTWIEWGKGKAIVGVDTDQNEFDLVEKTGGEKTHKLTVNEMPEHNHADAKPNMIQNNATGSAQYGYLGNGSFTSTGYSGKSQPHNNLPPYITCYIWKRTA